MTDLPDRGGAVCACHTSDVEDLEWCSYLTGKPWTALLPSQLQDAHLRHIAGETPRRGSSDCLRTLSLVSRVLCIKVGVKSAFELPIPVSAFRYLLKIYERAVSEECEVRSQGKNYGGAIEEFVWFVDAKFWTNGIFTGPTLNCLEIAGPPYATSATIQTKNQLGA